MKRRPALASGLLLLAMATTGSWPLSAQEPVEKKKLSAPPSAGWRAFRDPKTGKLREPTPEEALALSRETARKSAAPVTFEVVVHPDGTKSVDLQGEFAMSVVARRNADGSISYGCRPAAAAARTSAARAAGPAEK